MIMHGLANFKCILTHYSTVGLPPECVVFFQGIHVFGTFLKIISDSFLLQHSYFFLFRMEALSFQSYEMNLYINCKLIVLFG